MCKKRNSVIGEAWTKKIRLDSCMKNLISILNDFGYETLACCCGHGIYSMSIIVRYENGRAKDIISDKWIPRQKKFYKRDSKGFFYIPEAMKCFPRKVRSRKI